MNWIIAICVIVVIGAIYGKIRVATNFRLVYIRALRIEKSKEVALFEALKYVAGFLKPFEQLSIEDMHFIAATFHDLDDPPGALQPLLEYAEKQKNVFNLKDRESLLRWKALLLNEKRG